MIYIDLIYNHKGGLSGDRYYLFNRKIFTQKTIYTSEIYLKDIVLPHIACE